MRRQRTGLSSHQGNPVTRKTIGSEPISATKPFGLTIPRVLPGYNPIMTNGGYDHTADVTNRVKTHAPRLTSRAGLGGSASGAATGLKDSSNEAPPTDGKV